MYITMYMGALRYQFKTWHPHPCGEHESPTGMLVPKGSTVEIHTHTVDGRNPFCARVKLWLKSMFVGCCFTGESSFQGFWTVYPQYDTTQ